MRMEVRCCCQPKKLLGWLDVPKGARSFKVAIMELNQSALRAHFSDGCVNTDQFVDRYCTPRIVELPIATIVNEGRTYKAIKSEETPIETLRMISGFAEAPHAKHSH